MAGEPGAATLVSSGPTFEVWRGPKGALRLDWTRKGAVRLLVERHGYGEFATAAVHRFEEAVRATRRVTIYADFWEMTSYDSQLRVDMQVWGSKHRVKIEAVHVALQSKLVAMGTEVAKLAMGVNLHAYTKKAEFDVECQRASLPIGGLATTT